MTGAVVMLIGFNLATVATTTYFPHEEWIGLMTTAFVILVAVLGRGFFSRIAIFLALIFGYLISWIADQINQVKLDPSCVTHCAMSNRVDWSGVRAAHWIGIPKTITSLTFGASPAHICRSSSSPSCYS